MDTCIPSLMVDRLRPAEVSGPAFPLDDEARVGLLLVLSRHLGSRYPSSTHYKGLMVGSQRGGLLNTPEGLKQEETTESPQSPPWF